MVKKMLRSNLRHNTSIGKRVSTIVMRRRGVTSDIEEHVTAAGSSAERRRNRVRAAPMLTALAMQPQWTGAGPMLVVIARSAGCPWGNTRRRRSARRPRNAATSASMARARIGKNSWLGEPGNGSVGHGVAFHQGRSGGVEYAHDTLPAPRALTTSHMAQ
jgi:hypothetical protein